LVGMWVAQFWVIKIVPQPINHNQSRNENKELFFFQQHLICFFLFFYHKSDKEHLKVKLRVYLFNALIKI
jgi:hypothetical protein